MSQDYYLVAREWYPSTDNFEKAFHMIPGSGVKENLLVLFSLGGIFILTEPFEKVWNLLFGSFRISTHSYKVVKLLI